jgi:hypothetical protein
MVFLILNDHRPRQNDGTGQGDREYSPTSTRLRTIWDPKIQDWVEHVGWVWIPSSYIASCTASSYDLSEPTTQCLNNHVTKPNLTPTQYLTRNLLRSDPVNRGLDGDRYWSYCRGGFDSSGRLLEMGINQIYGTCTDLYDDDIIPSVMLCVPVFLTAARARSSGLSGKRKAPNKRYRIDLAWSCSDASNRPCKWYLRTH